MKAIHNKLASAGFESIAVVNIVKSKNESNSQPVSDSVSVSDSCCKYR